MGEAKRRRELGLPPRDSDRLADRAIPAGLLSAEERQEREASALAEQLPERPKVGETDREDFRQRFDAGMAARAANAGPIAQMHDPNAEPITAALLDKLSKQWDRSVFDDLYDMMDGGMRPAFFSPTRSSFFE